MREPTETSSSAVARFCNALEEKGLHGLVYFDSRSGRHVIGIHYDDQGKLFNEIKRQHGFTNPHLLLKSFVVRKLNHLFGAESRFSTRKPKRYKIRALINGIVDTLFIIDIWSAVGEKISPPPIVEGLRSLWRVAAEEMSIFSKGGFKRIDDLFGYPVLTKTWPEIDFVFTWVSDQDPKWRRLISEFAPQGGEDVERENSGSQRFEDRGQLLYALRAIDENASFFRKIFIVSNCDPPNWLDIGNEGLDWIKHEEILPKSALPTFNSHSIEAAIHRIPGLSEHFVYLNDDFFISRKASPSDFFFCNGVAKVQLSEFGIVFGKPNPTIPNYFNAAINAQRALEHRFGFSATNMTIHSPRPMRRSIWSDLESHFQAELDRTIHNKFRNSSDVNPNFLYMNFSIIAGSSVPGDVSLAYIDGKTRYFKPFCVLFLRKVFYPSSLPLSICVNDVYCGQGNGAWNKVSEWFLRFFFSSPSQFEIPNDSHRRVGSSGDS